MLHRPIETATRGDHSQCPSNQYLARFCMPCSANCVFWIISGWAGKYFVRSFKQI